MVGIVAVILLIAFEAMAVATAMPRAVAELHGLAFYAWAFSGFVVASLFAMVVAGEACDARGPRLPLLGGVGRVHGRPAGRRHRASTWRSSSSPAPCRVSAPAR